MGALARLLGRRSADGATAADGGERAPRPSPRSGALAEGPAARSGLTTPQLRATWLAVSWLLTYPDEATVSRLGRWPSSWSTCPNRPHPAAQHPHALREADPVSCRSSTSTPSTPAAGDACT